MTIASTTRFCPHGRGLPRVGGARRPTGPGLPSSQEGSHAAPAGGGHRRGQVGHPDDGRPDVPAAEVVPGTTGQALEAGRDGRQVLGILAAQIPGGSDGQTVAGQDQGLVHMGNTGDQIVKEPAQIGIGALVRTIQLLRVTHMLPLGQSSLW